MKLLRKLLILMAFVPLFLFLFTYVQFPQVTWDERVMYCQVTYWYPALEYLSLWGGIK